MENNKTTVKVALNNWGMEILCDSWEEAFVKLLNFVNGKSYSEATLIDASGKTILSLRSVK